MRFSRNYQSWQFWQSWQSRQSWILKFLVSASLIGFLFFFAEPAQILESIRNVDFLLYLLAVLIYLVAQGLNAGKWHLLLPEVEYRSLLKFTFVGAFYTLILPGQLSGEIAKIWRITRGSSIAERVAASVFIDRLTGIIALLLLALIGAGLSTSEVARFVLLPCGLVVMALLLLVFLMRLPPLQAVGKSLVRWLLEPFPFLHNQLPKVLRLIDSLAHYAGDYKKLMASILIGFVFQLAVVAIASLFVDALGMSIGFLDLAWIMGIISLLIFLPISISGVGVRELGFVGLLSLFQINVSLALTLSLLLFSLHIIGAGVGAAFEYRAQGKS